MSPAILVLFLRKETLDLRSNKQLWPAYLLLPLVAVLLPVLLFVLLPVMLAEVQRGSDPALSLLLQTAAADPSLRGGTIAERLGRLLLRDMGLFYILIGVILASSSAALALVREKEQRTLEPILATPLGDRELLLAKLIAALGPALAVTWVSALAGSLAGLLAGFWRTGAVILPTAGNLVGWLLLAPALAAFAALGALRVSARFTDVPGATQFTGLVVVPLSLIVVAVLGRPAMASALFGLAGTLVAGLLVYWLFGRNVKRFRREEILTKWK
jgi:ABC-type Na+ efflux pump permease subunit